MFKVKAASAAFFTAFSKRLANFGVLSTHLFYMKQLQAAVVGIVYITGYLNWSVAWFICPVILSVLRDQWRVKSENKRNIAKAAALSSEKDLVLARLDDLPSWVCCFI